MTKALDEAVARRPPHGSGTTDSAPNRAISKTAVGSASSAATPVGLTPNSGTGAYFTFVSTGDAHIRFGAANVAAATTSDYLLRAGTPDEWWCESNEDAYFTILRDTADGSLYWYRSGG